MSSAATDLHRAANAPPPAVAAGILYAITLTVGRMTILGAAPSPPERDPTPRLALVPAAAAAAGSLQGHLDVAERGLVAGWAWDERRADQPVVLEVLDNGTVLARIVADCYRPDLQAAGIGDGRHGFRLLIPGGLSPHRRHVLAVRRTADGAELCQSPRVIEAATGFDEAVEQHLTAIVEGLLPGPAARRALAFLTAQAEQLVQRCAAVAHPGPRALVVDERLPDAARDGGSQAILSHMRTLRGLGYHVSIVAADDPLPQAAALAALQDAGIAAWHAPADVSVEAVLRRHAGCFDVVYLHRVSMAARYLELARLHCPRARIVYSVADLHHLRLARQAQIETRPDLFAQSRSLRRLESAAATAADAVLTHSAYEVAELRRVAPGAAVHLVPWVQPVSPTGIPFAARRGVAFIGSFDHAPNADAARFLAERIMPLVWRVDPDLECLLVGSAMPEAIRRLARPGLLVVGAVAELRMVFDRVRLTVAPLRYGAGLKSKVLVSLAAGVPCVMTPLAAEGIDLSPPLRAAVGSAPEALAAHILRLHGDAAANTEAGEAGIALIAEQFGEARVAAALAAAIASAGPNGGVRSSGC